MPLHFTYRFHHLLLLLVLSVAQPVVMAESQRYDVEIIIFANTNPSDQGEVWPYADDGGQSLAGNYATGRFTQLPAASHRLKPVRYTLQQGGSHAVLYHRAWRQVPASPSRSVGYPVQATASNRGERVDGVVQLKRGRYLHMEVDLQLLDIPLQSPGQYLDTTTPPRAYRLREKRRIRSNKLHYFDHPRFGMLALVTPVSVTKPAEDVAPATDTTDTTTPEASTQPATEPAVQGAP